jgi:heme exporter protein C
MYIHVPCAWISLISYIILGILSVFYLIYQDRACSIAANAATIISLNTCFITLVTGSIWGKAAWGTWWIWDPRLTAVFIQFCLLSVCYMLRNAGDNNSTLEQSSALLTIVGLINIPIIKFAVNAWNSIHQDSSVFRFDGAKIHQDLLYPLLLSFVSIGCFYLAMGLLIAKNSLNEMKLRRKYQ